MNQEISEFSLKRDVTEAIKSFLFEEGFNRCEIVPHGIMNMINQISDYYEEGVPLFPEVILTNDYTYFQMVPSQDIIIKETALSIDEFSNALKLCAPLAVNNWVIFIELKNSTMKYGLINAELSDTSPSIYNQTVGYLGENVEGTTVAYIRNVGLKNVELVGFKTRKVISLNLDNIISVSNAEIGKLSTQIVIDVNSEYDNALVQYFEKTISNTIKTSHGNLIGIIKDEITTLNRLKTAESDGVFLDCPINIAQLVMDVEQEKTSELSIELRNHTAVFTSMLNHDGITVITTTGKIIGYHLFIKNNIPDAMSVVGGARSRAYHSMIHSGLFEMCFFKSQDGNMKLWSKENE